MKTEFLRGEHIEVADHSIRLLDDFSFELYEGETLGICGLSGSGKTVLADLLTGRRRLSSGVLFHYGHKVAFNSLQEAQKIGIFDIQRNSKLIPDLSVYENLVLISSGARFLNIGKLEWVRKIRDIFQSLGLSYAMNVKVRTLSPADKYFLEITRALLNDCRLMIFDDITYDCSMSEYAKFREIQSVLKEKGLTQIYIESRIERLIGAADRIMVLRSGSDAYVFDAEHYEEKFLLKAMEVVPREADKENDISQDDVGDEIFSMKGMSFGSITCENFAVREREFVGLVHENTIAPTELMRMFRGELPVRSGTAYLRKKPVDMSGGVVDLVRQGIGFLDGYREIGMENRTVTQNLLLPSYPYMSGLLLNKRMEKTVVEDALSTIGLQSEDGEKRLNELSFFEQQLVIYERWLLARPALLVLDNPFRNMDIRALDTFRDYIRRFKENGIAVICTMPYDRQYMKLCDRIYKIENDRIREID